MKALSFRQPWADLVAWGLKDVENRTWRTDYRGRILIHASSEEPCDWLEIFDTVPLLKDARKIKPGHPSDISKAHRFARVDGVLGPADQSDRKAFDFFRYTSVDGSFPIRAIFGEVDIVDCVQGYDSPWAVDGSWHWILANPVRYDNPILGVMGKLKFWEYQHGE